MYEVARFGPVVRIRMAATFLGRPLLWVNAYWVDGLLIDTGCRHTVPELLTALKRHGLRVEQLVNTHTDEDHIGGNAAVADRYGIVPRAHAQGLPKLANPEPTLPLYRRFYWGVAGEGRPGEQLGPTVETDHYRFTVTHTPGHAPDHVTLFEDEEGWLFSGDLFLSARLSHVRKPEQPAQLLHSMRRMAALPIERLFCSHSYRVHHGPEPLLAKVAYWERLQADALRLGAAGLSPARVTRELLGGPGVLEWVSGGEFSKRHLIAGLMGGVADVAAGAGGGTGAPEGGSDGDGWPAGRGAAACGGEADRPGAD